MASKRGGYIGFVGQRSCRDLRLHSPRRLIDGIHAIDHRLAQGDHLIDRNQMLLITRVAHSYLTRLTLDLGSQRPRIESLDVAKILHVAQIQRQRRAADIDRCAGCDEAISLQVNGIHQPGLANLTGRRDYHRPVRFGAQVSPIESVEGGLAIFSQTPGEFRTGDKRIQRQCNIHHPTFQIRTSE